MCCVARSLWRWSNYLQSRDPPGRPRVLINLDETSVRLVPQEGCGHVSKRAYRLYVKGIPMGRKASLAAQRSAITHVAAICDHPDFQLLLPQVVLVGENQINEARLAALRLGAPHCVRIWKCTTAWMTSATMVQYIRLLGRCLNDFRHTHRFILYLDAFRAHVSAAVLRAASSVDLWVCVVPGKMAWALQPCDTHLFSGYKRLLGEEFQRRSGLTAAGDISWELVLESLWHVITSLMHAKNWSHAFASVGLGDQQRTVSRRTKAKLQLAEQTCSSWMIASQPLQISFTFSRKVLQSLFTSCFLRSKGLHGEVLRRHPMSCMQSE